MSTDEVGIEAGMTLDPEALALEGATGVPAILAGGAAWLLHPGGLLNGLDEVRDRIYDRVRLKGAVRPEDVREAAVSLLLANYDLGLADAVALVDGAEGGLGSLVAPVLEAMFGPQERRKHRTYTSWAASALIANGIDPASVPTRLMPEVLDHLVASGRAIPQDKGVDADEAARKVAGLMALADAQAADRAAGAGGYEPRVISGPAARPAATPPAPQGPPEATP